MCTISFNIPKEILLDLHEDKDNLTKYIKQTVALNMYTNKKVSLGYCADIAGMSEENFIKLLGERKILKNERAFETLLQIWYN